ncbi:MAG: ATP-binding protein, partial [Flavitalea sp.]
MMALKNFEWRILARVLGLFVTLFITSFILIKGFNEKGWYIYLTIMFPLIIYQLVDFYRFQRKAHTELDQFVESVHYRDFSRYF